MPAARRTALRLAAQLERFRGVPTLSGKVSFTKNLHSVFGRQYRVIKIQNNKAKRVGMVIAKVVPKIWAGGGARRTPMDTRRPGELLRASAVSRSFAGVRALNSVSLDVRRSEIVGLIGPNGAGKSTLVNVLSGFDRPDSGSVELGRQGHDALDLASPRAQRPGPDVPAQPTPSAR